MRLLVHLFIKLQEGMSGLDLDPCGTPQNSKNKLKSLGLNILSGKAEADNSFYISDMPLICPSG